MSTELVEEIPCRLREELDRVGLSLAGAARVAGEPNAQRVKDVVSGKQRCPVDLLARLGDAGVDIFYVMTGRESRRQRESVGGVDAVLDRMYDALGVSSISMEMALDVSSKTLNDWRKKGKVPTEFIATFARQHKLRIEAILYGEAPGAGLTAEPVLCGREDPPLHGDQAYGMQEPGAVYGNEQVPNRRAKPQSREEMAKGTELDPAWPQVLEWVYDELRAQRSMAEMPTGRKLRDMVTAVLAVLRLEEGEMNRETARRKIAAIL